jgi:alpha-ketoglutaric semialdehyde dehydrogenase
VNSPALVLVDLQNDYLDDRGLAPSPAELIRAGATLLDGCRAASVPVVHVQTTVSRDLDNRMPHWRRAGRWDCVEGTDGHAAPDALRRRDGEATVDKQFFSGFSAPQLEPTLKGLGAATLIVAGVHLHGCVRATVLDAYQRGFVVWVATDAVGSYDPLHAAVSRRYLEGRAARFAEVDSLLALLRGPIPAETVRSDGSIERRSPRRREEVLWRLPTTSPAEIGEVAASAAAAGGEWRRTAPADRIQLLERLAALVAAHGEELAERLTREIGKPLRYARAEIERAVALLEATVQRSPADAERTSEAEIRHPPLGTVAQITPWNNPLAIPLGKLAPALRWGNAVVWKPAPAGSGIAMAVSDLLSEAGCPGDLVSVVLGGADAAAMLMSDSAIDAVSLTGSSQAGYTAQAICAERRIPLQAELGGNNAAIVWGDCELASASAAIAEAGFGAAGQRCTANRRVIVDDACHDAFLEKLEGATAALRLGDPLDADVTIGPLVSDAARERVAASVERARETARVLEPAVDRQRLSELLAIGPYHPPVLVVCEDPAAEVVQEETFGPLICVQRATSFEHALELLNGVEQGLVASLFSSSDERRRRFEDAAQAGILKLDRATADAGAETPFGGWKRSGVGPPEHGSANRDFYARTQAVYS